MDGNNVDNPYAWLNTPPEAAIKFRTIMSKNESEYANIGFFKRS